MKNARLLAAGMMVISSVCFAGPPGEGDKKNGQDNSRREQMRKRFQQGQGAGENGGRPGFGGMQGDPAQMVSMMLSRFDEDGDQKLDAKELTALFTKMRGMMGRRGPNAGEQGGPGAKGPGAKGQGAKGQGQGAKGRGRNRGAGEGGDAGGQRPKRPGRPTQQPENA